MGENKVSIKKQLFLEACMWLFVAISISLREFSLNSKVIDYVYIVTSIVIVIFIFLSFKKQEEIDEMSREILGKVNEMCIKSIILITIGFSFFAQSDLIFTSGQVFAILTIIIFIVRVLRAVLFTYYDKKGISV